MKRLLITGASGFLGFTLCRLAVDSWDVTGVHRAHPFELDRVRSLRCDLARYGDVKALLAHVRPDAVIHAAAISQIEICQAEREASRRVNVDATANLAGLCADLGIPFLFTSTDLVFDGRNPPYREQDAVSPVNIYGEHKVLAEAMTMDRHPAAVICRMALMFGRKAPGGASFLQGMLRKAMEGESMCLFTDEVRTPLGADHAARGIFMALERGGPALLHLGGPERISRFDFGQLVQDVFELSDARFTPCGQADLPMRASRPPDVSLDSSEAGKLGFAPPPLVEQLEELRDHWKERLDAARDARSERRR